MDSGNVMLAKRVGLIAILYFKDFSFSYIYVPLKELQDLLGIDFQYQTFEVVYNSYLSKGWHL